MIQPSAPAPAGGYTVAAPGVADRVVGTLQAAYSVTGDLPSDMTELLQHLNSLPAIRSSN